MVLKMPVVLSKHERLLESFRTGVGLSFDGTGIDHMEKHRHAVRGTQNHSATETLEHGHMRHRDLRACVVM